MQRNEADHRIKNAGAELGRSSRRGKNQEMPGTVKERFVKDVLEGLQRALETGEPVALAILDEIV